DRAGIAGAIYEIKIDSINPSAFSPGNSIEIAIWVSLGGRGNLIGAIIGAALVNLAKTWLASSAPEIWLFFLGGLFVLTTLLFPRGIAGVFRDLRWSRPGAGAPAEAPLAIDESVASEKRA